MQSHACARPNHSCSRRCPHTRARTHTHAHTHTYTHTLPQPRPRNEHQRNAVRERLVRVCAAAVLRERGLRLPALLLMFMPRCQTRDVHTARSQPLVRRDPRPRSAVGEKEGAQQWRLAAKFSGKYRRKKRCEWEGTGKGTMAMRRGIKGCRSKRCCG